MSEFDWLQDLRERDSISIRLRKYRSRLCKEQAESKRYCRGCSMADVYGRCVISAVLRGLGG